MPDILAEYNKLLQAASDSSEHAKCLLKQIASQGKGNQDFEELFLKSNPAESVNFFLKTVDNAIQDLKQVMEIALEKYALIEEYAVVRQQEKVLHSTGVQLALLLEKAGARNAKQLSQHLLNDSAETAITSYIKRVENLSLAAIDPVMFRAYHSLKAKQYNQSVDSSYVASSDDRSTQVLCQHDSIKGLSFVISGKLQTWKSRDVTKEHLERYGAILKSSVGKGTDYLVTNDAGADTEANRKAEKLGVRIIDENTFNEIVCWRFTDAPFISVPDWLEMIPDSAFTACHSLKRVSIHDNIKSIGADAFKGCVALTNITIPDGVTSIGAGAFGGCTGLTRISIPESVTSIGAEAFQGCSGLTHITVPKSVISIGARAFEDCSNTRDVVIPDSAKSIGDGLLKGCKQLADQQGFVIFRGVLFDYVEEYREVIVPNGVLCISENAFKDRKELTNVTIPEGVVSIASGAFKGCSKLTNISIPQSVTSISSSAFEGCSSLINITIPKKLSRIGWKVFKDCRSLTNVKIPGRVTSIELEAFSGCRNLNSISIPKTVASIEGRAFEGCSSLKRVTIPDNITCIKYDTFKGCSSLTSIDIPQSVTSIEWGAFEGCRILTIYAPYGSYAREYAKRNKIRFS